MAWGNGSQLAFRHSVSLLAWGQQAERSQFRCSFLSELGSQVQERAEVSGAAGSAPARLFAAGEAAFGESGIHNSGSGTQCQLLESQTDVSSFSSA